MTAMTNDRRYTFVTEWDIPAPVERVWDELMAPEQWPDWWRGVVRVELVRDGRADGCGVVRRYTWRSRLPYRLTFDMETIRIEPRSLIEGCARGELDGRGCWQLTPAGGHTRVRYDWEVAVTKSWMKRLDPLARRLFEWNHDVVMEWGRQGLVKRVKGNEL